MKQRPAAVICVIALSWLATACKEQVISGPGFVCDVTNPVRDVSISPSNASVLVRSPARTTDVIQLIATATNRLGDPRADVPFTFTSSDPAIATVDSTGLVHALKPGAVSIKASTCGESATAQITVINAVVTVTVTTAAQSAVVGDSVLVTARARGQTGDSLPDVKFTFAVSPPASATMKVVNDSTVYVFPTVAGNLTVTATGEGASSSTVIAVLPRSFLSGAVNVPALDVGNSYACGLISLGRAYCWGLNDHSQLGTVTDSVCFDDTRTHTDTSQTQTVVKPCSLLPRPVSPDISFVNVSAGDSSACAVATTGKAYCWGTNTHGELGNGNNGLRGTPTLVTAILNFSAVTVGGAHACALAVGGAAYCWGQDSLGQLGDAGFVNSSTPIPVISGSSQGVYSSISAGLRHTCALTSDGTAFCWGSNDSSQLGAGTPGGLTDQPLQVVTGARFSAISAGGDHTCAIAIGGAAFCWGSNALGQLGNGAPGLPSNVPVAVAGGQTFIRISAGRRHTCGLTSGGVIYCWGSNSESQLGIGPYTGPANSANAIPAPVGVGERAAGVTFTSVSAGINHTCAVGSDGSAYCWGSNVFGALGNTLQAAWRGLPQRVATPR